MGRKILAESLRDEKRILAKKGKETIVLKTRYQQWQNIFFSFLEYPETRGPMCYHVVILGVIFGSMVFSIVSTIESYDNMKSFQNFIFYYELLLLVWFSLEYIIRVWSCSVLSRFSGWYGRLKFMKTFYMLVDAFVIVSTIATTILQLKTSYFTLLRTTRCLQVARILRLDRQKGDIAMMFHVVYKHKKELITCYFVGFVILFGGAYVVYIIEKRATEPLIDNMVNGLYWGVITLTSVGYGDIRPVTWAGKIVAVIFAFVGCAFFSLPAGILGSGFAFQVARQKHKKRFFKVRNPAAIMIQTAWRNYAVRTNNYHIQGTWNYMFPEWPDYYASLPGIQSIINASSFGDYAVSIDKNHNTHHNTGMRKESWDRKRSNVSTKFIDETKKEDFTIPPSIAGRKFSNPLVMPIHEFSLRPSSRSFSNAKKNVFKEKPSRYKAIIRFILRVKYWTCVKSFKRRRDPYVDVKCIIEKLSQSHIEVISYLREANIVLKELDKELQDLKCDLRNYKANYAS